MVCILLQYSIRVTHNCGLCGHFWEVHSARILNWYPFFYFQKQISRIDEEFDFVLLSERFEESMVLLASKLCWPLDLVKSLKVNARKEAYKVCIYRGIPKVVQILIFYFFVEG